jgi:hypothetical protein
MTQLPQILSLSDRKVVILGVRPRDTARIRSFYAGHVETVATLGIAARLPESLQCLEILLGSRFDNYDDEALASVILHARHNCPNLKSVFVGYHVNARAHTRASVIFPWRHPSLKHFECRVVDKYGYEVLVVYRKTSKQQWEESFTRSFSRIPVNLLFHLSNPQDPLWPENLHELELSPPTLRRLPPANMTYMEPILTLIGGLRSLRKITLPLDFPSSLNEMLHALSALPNFHILVLRPPSSVALFDWINDNTVTDLVRGLQGFHHLWEVSLPLGLVRDDLLDSLATILDLQGLKFTGASTTSPTHATYRPVATGQFPSLCRLKVYGSLSNLANIVSACVDSQTTVLRAVAIVTHSLQHADEMRGTMQVLATQCRGLRKLRINIKDVHAMENRLWVDIMPLRGCGHLQEFIIKHPRPLSLCDANVLHLLDNWPHARHISLNPRPQWRTIMGYSLPTLTCLGHVAHKGRQLLHFGVYLNPCGVTIPGISQADLTEIDLGKSGRNRETTALICSLFPNAICL